MMAYTVKKLSIAIDQKNESSTFTNGDFISGRVTLEVVKEIHIDSFYIKAKGKASVLWSEKHGKNNVIVYYDKETWFKSIQYFIQEQKSQGQDGYALLTHESEQSCTNVVVPGIHVYPFTFQIPHEDMPATFKGYHGKVAYFLETKLCKLKWITTKAKMPFNYSPQGEMSIPELMEPQRGFKKKKLKFFASGNVSMNVLLEKTGYHLGEEINVRINVENMSSRSVKPKFCLYQKQSFFASRHRKLRIKELLKEEGEPVKPWAKETVTKVIHIPTSVSVSILNCTVLKVEYRLKVYLDIKFASNPEVKLPVVLFPVLESRAAASTDTCFGVATWTSKQAEVNASSCLDSAFGTTNDFYPLLDEASDETKNE